MTTTPSRIWTEIDFEADGKQNGYLQMPYSVTRSAYGNISIPLTVIRNGDGPTVLLMSGNHGDEYEGQVTLCRLIRELRPEDISGRVIVMPAANFPAAMAGARVSPLDDGNLNRSFPGDPGGGPTKEIAHYIHTVLAPMCDGWLDLHSGGSSLDYVPMAMCYLTEDENYNARARAALMAFGAPISVIWDYFDDKRLARSTAQDNNVIYIGTEAGGGGAVSPAGVQLTRNGVVRALDYFGVLKDRDRFPDVGAPGKIRLVEIASRDYFVYAPDAGLFEPFHELGAEVEAGAPAGCIHFVDDPGREPVTVNFKAGGVLICKRHFARVERGDCIAHLVTDIDGA